MITRVTKDLWRIKLNRTISIFISRAREFQSDATSREYYLSINVDDIDATGPVMTRIERTVAHAITDQALML